MKIKGIDTRKMLSKDEEIKILETLREAFKGTGNYLESLFTPELVDYATRQIKNDFPPDIHAFAQYQTDALQDYPRQIQNLQSDLGAMRQNFENERDLRTVNWEDLQRTRALLADKNDKIEALERELDKVRRFRVALKDFLAQA
jgi:hypothetical protein